MFEEGHYVRDNGQVKSEKLKFKNHNSQFKIHNKMTNEEKKEEGLAAIREINQAIRDGLNQWADIAIESEAKQWAVFLDYFPRDLINVTYLFQHVASNIGIKAGKIDEKTAKLFGDRLRRLIVDMTGHDPHNGMGDVKQAEGVSNYWK